MTFEFEKYKCDNNSILDSLKKYGIAIIPKILSQDEIDCMIDGMWLTLEHLTARFNFPIDRNNPKSFKSIKHLMPSHDLIFLHWSIGHADFLWQLRQNPKVADVFAKIWNVSKEELLVSFDGVSIQMPPEITQFGWFNNNSEKLFHTDQGFHSSEFECVQSWITAFDVNENDATLVILEGSHMFHREFGEYMVKSKKHSHTTDEQLITEFYIKERQCEKKLIKCPAGSIVLFDSRIIHYGQPAMQQRIQPNFRCVAYICMLPRVLCSKEELEKKREAFHSMQTTHHSPTKIKHFSSNPKFFDKNMEVQTLPRPNVSDLGIKLAGF